MTNINTSFSGDILTSLKQCPTPLNTLFFSEFNQNLLQHGIRQAFKNKYGIKIDYQDKDDLLALMRVMFSGNMANPYGETCVQVKFINEKVIDHAVSQISTGVSQYYGFIKDINSPIKPPAIPTNTSVYGVKMDINNKIGF